MTLTSACVETYHQHEWDFGNRRRIETMIKDEADNGQAAYASPKRANSIDVHVGGRVRLRRMLLGMSQEKLGDSLGVTFQQVQKYEKGTNRIYASRLYQLAGILDVPITFFFEELISAPAVDPALNGFAENAGNGEAEIMGFLNSREGVQLNRAFTQIEDPKVRRSIIDLVRSLANDSDDGGPGEGQTPLDRNA